MEESLNFMVHLKRHHNLPDGEHVYCGPGSDPTRQQHLPRSQLSAAKRAGYDCGGDVVVRDWMFIPPAQESPVKYSRWQRLLKVILKKAGLLYQPAALPGGA